MAKSSTNMETVLLCSKSKNGNKKNNSYRCSGLLIGERFVITTGIILIPFLNNEYFDLINNCNYSKLKMFDTNPMKKIGVWREIVDRTDVAKSKSSIIEATSRLVAIWKCPLVERTLRNVFFDWTIEHGCTGEKSLDNDEIRVSKQLLSIFAILELEDERCGNVGESRIASTLTMTLEKFLTRPVVRGREIKIISTPFGNDLFINSLSSGIISNLIGIENCLILTDARTVPGCEGAPIFSSMKSR